MEIDITRFVNESTPSHYSASQAELGPDAGRITWDNAKDRAKEMHLLDTPEKLEAMRQFALASGGWNEDEVSAWSDDELNALFIQWISGDIRELNELCGGDWSECAALAERGTVSGALFRADDGRVFYYLGG
jgi:hypothetical protein